MGRDALPEATMNSSLVIALALASERARAGLPTPQGARSLVAEERGYAFETYEVDGEPEEALQDYAGVLAKAHFRVRTIQGALAARGRETAIVIAFRERTRTVIALVRLGDEDRARDH
jgi:hypothetical protein